MSGINYERTIYIYDHEAGKMIYASIGENLLKLYDFNTKEDIVLTTELNKFKSCRNRQENTIYICKRNTFYIISTRYSIKRLYTPIIPMNITTTKNYIYVCNRNRLFACQKVNVSEKVEWKEIHNNKETRIKLLSPHPTKDIIYILLDIQWILSYSIDIDNSIEVKEVVSERKFTRENVILFPKKLIASIVIKKNDDILIYGSYYLFIYTKIDNLYVCKKKMRYLSYLSHDIISNAETIDIEDEDYHRLWNSYPSLYCRDRGYTYHLFKDGKSHTDFILRKKGMQNIKISYIPDAQNVRLYYRNGSIYLINFKRSGITSRELLMCSYCGMKISAWCPKHRAKLLKDTKKELVSYTIKDITSLLNKYITYH